MIGLQEFGNELECLLTNNVNNNHRHIRRAITKQPTILQKLQKEIRT